MTDTPESEEIDLFEDRNPRAATDHQRERLRYIKKRLPPSFPKWKRTCTNISWRTGKNCTSPCVLGTDRCRMHGGAGVVNALVGWRRYLLWILLPETIRTNGMISPILDQEIEIVCNILAQYIVTGDAHASESARMKAIEYLLESVSAESHPDPALLLTHLSRADADLVVKILRYNGLLK